LEKREAGVSRTVMKPDDVVVTISFNGKEAVK
jgi:hypothetical protein